MSGMNFTCDVCGREVFSCTFVNGMKFCAKCYQETFGETDKDRKIADLEAKLAESEEKKESYRLQNEQHHLQLLQFYSRLGVEAFGADIHEKALETLMIMKEEIEEKNGVRRALSACNRQNDEFSDMIKKLVNEKEELKHQLAEKDIAIENWQTMYKSVVQTCHNDKEEIERLNKKLATQEKTITNIVEDNRASQEWYKKQLEEKEKENTKLKEVVDCVDKLKQFNADMKDYALVNRDVADEIYCEHQDKISFAIEQLEQIRKEFEIKLKCCKWEDKMLVGKFCNITNEIIDNQINVLRNNKDGIH